MDEKENICIRTSHKMTMELTSEIQYQANAKMLQDMCQHNRPLSEQRPTELLTFEPPQDIQKFIPKEIKIFEERKTQTDWRMIAKDLTYKFGKETTIDGLNKVCGEGLSLSRRLLCFFTFLISLCFFIYVVTLLAARFNRHQFETVIDNTSYPVFKIPYPTVIICNENRLNWQRLEQAQRLFLAAEHQNSEMYEHFAHIVGLFNTLIYGNFKLFNNLPEKSVLKQLNYINYTNVVDFMSWRCDEIFVSCIWRTVEYNCCDIFTHQRNQLGQCLAFNSVEGEEGKRKLESDPKYPWRTGGGRENGLQVKIILDDTKTFPNKSKKRSITVTIAEPFCYTDIGTEILSNTKAMIALDAVMHVYDKYTWDVHPEERKCILEEEHGKYNYFTLPGHKYMMENCLSQCQQLRLIHYCNCTLDLLFPTDNYPVCKLVDLPCLAKYNQYLQFIMQPEENSYINRNISGIECKCYYNCMSLTYVSDTNIVELPDLALENKGKEIIDLNVFFRMTTLLLYRTRLVFTWVDLLASFGGIAGLFLGCSLMSIVELAVFLFISVPQSILSHRQEMNQQKEQESKRIRV